MDSEDTRLLSKRLLRDRLLHRHLQVFRPNRVQRKVFGLPSAIIYNPYQLARAQARVLSGGSPR